MLQLQQAATSLHSVHVMWPNCVSLSLQFTAVLTVAATKDIISTETRSNNNSVHMQSDDTYYSDHSLVQTAR